MSEASTESQSTEKLQKRHQRKGFDSGRTSLDEYLQRRAGQEQRRYVSATFVVCDDNQPDRVVGYYTLSAISVDVGGIDDNSAQRLPHYPEIPAILLGRLAVDRGYQGTGLGGWLLIDALFRAYRQAQVLGAWAVIVDAIDDDAVAFYQHYGFEQFADDPSRLYLPMSKIAKL